MFEDSTFESTGRIRTRSRGWMMAAFLFNGSILLALVLIPLIYPEALPRQWMSILIEAPPPPAPHVQEVKPVPQMREKPEMLNGQIFAPPRIPPTIRYISVAEPPSGNFVPGASDLGQGAGEIPGGIFPDRSQQPVVHQATGPVRVPSIVLEGMLLHKVVPTYPVIAKVTRKEGLVVLQATISAAGTIENLRVLSGEPMLRQAALDAVSQWRYRPYLLNGVPVEVETTVNVVFRLMQ
jgi:protein TonB